MMVRRDRNIPSEFKDPGVWTFRITWAAKVLKFHKETKKATPTGINRNLLPPGAGSQHQRLVWAGKASEVYLCADSGTAWNLGCNKSHPLGESATCLLWKSRYHNFRAETKAAGLWSLPLDGTISPERVLLAGGKRAVMLGESFYSPFVCGVLPNTFSSSLLLVSFNQYLLNICNMLDTIY